ncbi:MAG: glycoside hydrolase family 127 protein [Clostridia bacterium]|nr:glycoside hydrolase family 127 protein [Clostridia bacterium]
MELVPLVSVRPEGWLKEQIRLESDGFFGHLTDISPHLEKSNGWLEWKKTAEEFAAERGGSAGDYISFAWEEQAYWLRGAYRLSLLSGNTDLAAQCEPYFGAVLASAREDGYFGPESLRNTPNKAGTAPDIWPHMVMADVLKDRYIVTGDTRITDLLTAFFHFCLDLPDEKFIPPNEMCTKWYGMVQVERCCDMLPVIWWLYGLTGDMKLPKLAARFLRLWEERDCSEADLHVVTFAQRMRYQASRFPLTKDPADISASAGMYLSHMKKWGQMPGGLYAADERCREGKRDPRQAMETCGMSEILRSFGYMASLTEDPVWFDRIEDIMFNSFPATHTPDYSGIHYLTADNQPELDALDHDYFNAGCQTRYSAFNYRCCQHNAASAWPNFVSSLFAHTDDGLAVCAYAPCVFEGTAAGHRITLKVETEYPFRETVAFTVSSDGPFTLRLRVPGWAKDASVSKNGSTVPADISGGWITLDGACGGDRIELRLPMEPTFREFPDNGGFVCLDRGPLTYSLLLRENWIPAESHTDRAGRVWTDLDVKAEPPYCFALDTSGPVCVSETETVPDQPFKPESAPVTITVRGKQAEGWGIGDDNTIMPVPPSPARSSGEYTELKFVPLGCMRARMSCFPVLGQE